MKLSDFDPHLIADQRITRQVLDTVWRYVRLVQGPRSLTWQDIAVGGYYGTAALLHEVVELRILLGREPDLLRKDRSEIKAFWEANRDAHVEALIAEHEYLAATIEQVFGQRVSLGTLILSNAGENDFYLVVHSAVPKPIHKPSEDDVEHADVLIEWLRALGKEMF